MERLRVFENFYFWTFILRKWQAIKKICEKIHIKNTKFVISYTGLVLQENTNHHNLILVNTLYHKFAVKMFFDYEILFLSSKN